MPYLRIFIVTLCWATVLSVTAQVMDNRTRAGVAAVGQRRAGSQHDAPAHKSYYPMVIRLADIDNGLAELADLGARIFYTRGDMALACVPRDKAGDLERTHFVDGATMSKARKSANLSRSGSHVDAVHSGNSSIGLSAYTGRGVVAGICDIGFDPSHIAFSGRLGMFAIYNDTLAVREIYAPGSSLATTDVCPTTDTPSETHGTHVANIIAGGIDDNPYYGAAPGSTLCVVTSQLSDMALLCGIEDIIAYAKERGEPAVINLSVGENMGPHDGSDLVNRYLDLLSDDALICFSAGNTGDSKNNLQYTFGEPAADGSPDMCGSMFESSLTWNGFDLFGAIDLWSGDSRGFEVRIIAYDQVERRIVYTGPWTGSADGSESGMYSLSTDDEPVLANIFPKSGIVMSFGPDKYSGRYNAYFEFIINPVDELPGGNHWARYICGWQVRAASGTSLQAYSDGIYSFMRKYGVPGQSDGNAELSISNLCCNDGTISVGAWNTRNRVPVWGGQDVTYDFETDRVAFFSSYGTLSDGRVLPHFCAPGNYVISAMSAPYHSAHPEAEYAAEQTSEGVTYRWTGMCGTSMASPMAAGIMALWLEAYPQLSVAEARDIACRTARRDFADIDDIKWGHGAIDAAAGLAEVLRLNGIDNITGDNVTAVPETWHTLAGVRLPGRPTMPGVYIVMPQRLKVRVGAEGLR